MHEPEPHVIEAARRGDVDAFVRAYRFLKRYRGDSRFSTWLFAIARNCAHDELRRAGRRQRVSARLHAQPPRASLDQTTGIEVREALGALPLELREPVVLIDMFGTSYREVSRMLKVPEGTIKSRVHRARELLAASLTPKPEETTGES